MVVVFTRKLWVSAQCCIAVLSFQFCILLSPFESFSRTLGNVLRCRLFIMKACIHLGYSTVTVTKQTLTVTADKVLEGNTCAKQNLPKTTAVTHQFLRSATGYGRDRMVRVPVSSEGQHGQAVSLFPTVPSACQGVPADAEAVCCRDISICYAHDWQPTNYWSHSLARITSARKGGTDVRQRDCSHNYLSGLPAVYQLTHLPLATNQTRRLATSVEDLSHSFR